jgi:hypothetical protein
MSEVHHLQQLQAAFSSQAMTANAAMEAKLRTLVHYLTTPAALRPQLGANQSTN